MIVGKIELINVLITCNHVLSSKILLSSENIKIEINKKEKVISKKGRRIFTNDKLDYTCIEILDDDWTIVTADGEPSAHYEHTVVVTKDGYEILTKR